MLRQIPQWVAILLLIFGLLSSSFAQQDKRPLEHEDYDQWKTISGTTLSGDGKWLMYSLTDGKDVRELKIRGTESSKEYSIKDARSGQFTFDSKFAVYRIVPNQQTIRELKKKETPEDEMPQEKFQLLDLENGSTITFDQNQSFAMPQEHGEWIAILLKPTKPLKSVEESKTQPSESFEVTPEGLKRSKNEEQSKGKKEEQVAESKPKVEPNKPGAPSASKAKIDSKKDKKEKKAGTTLILRNLKSGLERRFPDVAEFVFDKKGRALAIATSADRPEGDGVSVIDLPSGDQRQIISGIGNYRRLTFNSSGKRLAFLTDRDDYENKDSSWSLYHWRAGQSKALEVAAEGSAGLPEQWWLSSTSGPFFNESNRYLFFYTAPKPADVNEEEDKHKDPTAKLDVWHWQDPLLQPQQLVQLRQERERSYLASFDLRTKKIRQLATKEMPTVILDPERKSDLTIGISDEKYKKTISWDMPGFRDVYLVDLRNGDSELVLEKVRNAPSLSPSGKYLIWWDTESRNWFTLSVKNPSLKVNASEAIEHPLFNELHDTPSDPRSYGLAGWTEDDKFALIYDRYDIWKLDPTGSAEPVCITDGAGREQKIRLRYQRLDREARNIDLAVPVMLTAFNETTRDSGYQLLDLESASDDSNLKTLIMLPERLAQLSKAKDADRLVFTRSTFERFPDIWSTTSKFDKITRMSKANPQQFEFSWGTVELTKWNATDGQEIEGMIYKPENFDPETKYPMIVYFYERYSDRLHSYYTPAAGRSIINFTFYTSRGYVVFVPDIPYKTGEPGPSAANSVLPGVEHVIDLGYVDEDRIGMQGHSWGGYQTAYLVTQTDRFACAESGAPVSNMTSAYGGIRWASGLSRMFQYERTQSRIGDTLWNAREKYIANSPLFFVDKINTPLLILHNDEDGAVPWYQGIELFVAMRRLEKPAWLLNYNGNPHWVMGRENRLDFAKRMQQFFDHYLKDEPMPTWMSNGIPAVEKGKEFGFEFQETETEPQE